MSEFVEIFRRGNLINSVIEAISTTGEDISDGSHGEVIEIRLQALFLPIAQSRNIEYIFHLFVGSILYNFPSEGGEHPAILPEGADVGIVGR